LSIQLSRYNSFFGAGFFFFAGGRGGFFPTRSSTCLMAVSYLGGSG
jgi:hypothetical protein